MTTKAEIREAKPPIYLDELDEELVELIEKEGKIALSDLPKQYPDLEAFPRTLLWYRVHSLSANGLIRVKRARRDLLCFSLGG